MRILDLLSQPETSNKEQLTIEQKYELRLKEELRLQQSVKIDRSNHVTE
jgi:hypothetical protein